MNKDTQLALDKLKDLIQKDGVFYALLFSLFEDSHISISKLYDYDPNLRISSDESHWLIGFLIQYNKSFLESYPKDINDFISLGKEIHDVLKELEYSYAKSYSTTAEDIYSQNNILAALSVAIHYDGNSAYDYEYADFAIKRYDGIKSWLMESKNIDIHDCIRIAKEIKFVFFQKTNCGYYVDINQAKMTLINLDCCNSLNCMMKKSILMMKLLSNKQLDASA